MVVMSLEQYSALTDGVELALDEADRAAADTETRYSADEVFERVRSRNSIRQKFTATWTESGRGDCFYFPRCIMSIYFSKKVILDFNSYKNIERVILRRISNVEKRKDDFVLYGTVTE